MTAINHDEAARVARGLGVTYHLPDDEAVRLVFAAYLELKERDDKRVCCAESERMRESSKRRTCELERGCDELKTKLDAAKTENEALKNFFGPDVYEWSGPTEARIATCRICKTTSAEEDEDHAHASTCPFFYVVEEVVETCSQCGLADECTCHDVQSSDDTDAEGEPP